MSGADRQPMKLAMRTLGLALVVTSMITLRASDAVAQRVVMVHQEPRHRLVWQNEDLKLLDVQIQPGDTTLNHTHASPIMYTFISNGQGSWDGRTTANLDYANEPFTHAVTNEGPGLFRIIALAHYGPAVADGQDAPPTGLSSPQLENAYFRSYRIELAPGEETGTIEHSNPAFIIQVSDGHADVSRAKGYGADLMAQGDWTRREAHSPYRIRNAGTQPLSVVINEGRETH